MARRKGSSGRGVIYQLDFDTKAIRQALTGLPKELRREIRAPLKASGEVIRQEMLSRVPRATGALARGVKTRVDVRSLKVRVVSMHKTEWRGRVYDYGRALEFHSKRYGTRYKWFYPSFDDKKDEAYQMFEHAVDNALRRVGLRE